MSRFDFGIFGESDRTVRTRSVSMLIAVMDVLKIPTAVLAGFDWGGARPASQRRCGLRRIIKVFSSRRSQHDSEPKDEVVDEWAYPLGRATGRAAIRFKPIPSTPADHFHSDGI